MDPTTALVNPGVFEANLQGMQQKFYLIYLGLEGLSHLVEQEQDVTTDYVDSILNYACDLQDDLSNLNRRFPEMLAAARAKGRTKRGAA